MSKRLNFYDLAVWKEGHQLALDIYKITKDFPKEELFGITSQLRRSAISITANLAEGYERYFFKDKLKFYYYSRGSAAEVYSFLFIVRDLNYINKNNF